MARKLVFVRASGCGVCREKAPVAQKIAGSMELPLEVIDLDTEEGRARAEKLRMRKIPTLALLDGERIPFRLVGRMITPETVAYFMERIPER